MNGGAGLRFEVLTATARTTGRLARSASAWRRAVSASSITGLWPAIRTSSAAKGVPSGASSVASIVQYSRATNARISRSRSTTRRTATDWTRPAERPERTFREMSGLSV